MTTQDDPIEITRGFQFGIIAADLMRDPSLSPTVKAVYALLATYADRASRAAFPSRPTMAEGLACSLDTIDRAITTLETAGWITVQKRRAATGGHRSSIYVLTDLNPTEGAASMPLPSRTQAATPSRTQAATPSRTHAAHISTTKNKTTKNTTTRTEQAPSPAPLGEDVTEQMTLTLVDGQGPKQPGQDAPGFDPFWAACPKKVDKQDALRAYRKAIKEGATPAFLLEAVQGYAFSAERQFIPAPAVWLNKRRWEQAPADQPGNTERAAAGPKRLTAAQQGISTRAEIDASGRAW